MPKWYRLNSSGDWSPLKIYRLNSSGAWQTISKIYRLYADGIWKLVHSSALEPSVTSSPTLRNATNIDPTTSNINTLFSGGNVITLTKGTYSNTDADTKYTLTIRRSINYNNSLGSWETVAGPIDLIGNATGTVTYTVTDLEAKGGYYFAGRVRVDTDPTNPASTDYFFDVKNENSLAKVSFEISGFGYGTVTTNGATFFWDVTGLPSTDLTTYIYNQKLEIKRASDNITVYTLENIAIGSAGSTVIAISDPSILSSTTYYGVVTVTANDGWKTSNYPTSKTSSTSNFTTLAPRPVNIVSPAITPLNNRSYVPVNTQLACSTGSWTNSPTSYSYSWQYNNENNQLPEADRWGQIPGSTNSNIYTPPSNYTSLYNSKIRCLVTATNAAGSNEAIAGQYFVDPEVTISAISPTSVNAGQSTNFAFTISGYPTSYVIDWTNDGVTDYTSPAIASGTSSVNASVANIYSAGTSTLKVTAQPGNKQRTATITAANQPTASNFSKSDGTVTPSQPSTINFSSSNNQVTSTWTNGFPITSVTYTYSGAGTSGSLTDTTFPFVTSDLTAYSQSGTYTFTVTNFNNSLQVAVSWNQSNAASYRVDYSSSIFGGDVAIGDSSAGSVNVLIPWNSNMGTFTLSGITVYSGSNQTGLSTYYPNPSPGGIVPSQKSSSRSNSTFLTYTAPAVAPSAANTSGSCFATSLQIGGTVYASVSSSATAPVSYAYQLQYSFNNSTWSNQSGGESGSYTLQSFDVPNQYFRYQITASNSAGTYVFNTNSVGPTQSTPTPPSTPGTPTLTYVPANNTPSNWGYSATWGSSTGSGTIQYQIDALGSSGGTATRGLFSTNSASFLLSRNDSVWQIRVRATNDGGTTWSSYSNYSNSA